MHLSYLAALYRLCHHGDDIRPLLPNHLPEVSVGLGEWSLTGDVAVHIFTHLDVDEVGVDVISVSGILDNNSRLIICKTNRTKLF